MGETASKTRTDRLETLRDLQEGALSGTAGPIAVRDLASLSREYRATLAELDSLAPPAAQEGDAVDEIAQRRAARGAGTAKSRRHSAADQG